MHKNPLRQLPQNHSSKMMLRYVQPAWDLHEVNIPPPAHAVVVDVCWQGLEQKRYTAQVRLQNPP